MKKMLCGIVLSATVAVAAGVGALSSAAQAAPTAKVDTDASLSWILATTIQTLDPHKERTLQDRWGTTMIYDRLWDVDHARELKPMLATKWTFGPDGKTLTITLRSDAKFHDGSSVDAAAVKVSLDRARTAGPGITTATLLSVLTGVEVVNATTVRLSFSRAAGEIPQVLSTNAGMIVNPKTLAAGTDLIQGVAAAGSGPYVVKEFKAADRVAFERATDPYWDKKAAKIKSVTLIAVPDASTALNAIQSGQIDGGIIRDTVVTQARTISGRKLYEYDSGIISMFFETTREPVNNPAVRKAIAMGINRAEIAEGLLEGRCTASTQMFAKGTPGHAPSVKDPAKYSVTKAKQALAAAGYPNGADLEAVITANVSPYQEVATALQAQLASIGVRMSITPAVPSGSPEFVAKKYDAFVSVATSQPSPYQLIDRFFFTLNSLTGTTGTTLRSLLDSSVDPALSSDELAKVQTQIAQQIADNQWVIPICFQKQFYTVPKDVTGMKTMRWAWANGFDIRYLARTRAK